MRENLKYYIIISLINPLIGFVSAVKYIDYPIIRRFMIFLIGYFGFFMVFDQGMDGTRHAANVENHYSFLSFEIFLSELYSILKFSPPPGTNDDIFLHIISFFVSRFSTSIHVFFAVVSSIYGYFFVQGLAKVKKYFIWRDSFLIVLLFFLLALLKGIEGVNTVRTWTATWVFFNGVLGYYQTKNKKFIWLIAVTPLIHFAFFIYAASFIGIQLLRGNLRWVFIILIISIVFKVGFTNVSSLKSLSGFSKLTEQKYEVYALDSDERSKRYESKKEIQQKHGNFYKANYLLITSLFTQVLAVFFGAKLLTGKIARYKNNWLPKRMIGISIILWSLGNFFFFVPAVYNRGMIISSLFLVTAVIMVLVERGQKGTIALKRLTWVAIIPTLVIVILYKMSAFLGFLDFGFLLPPVVAFFLEDSVSIRQFIKEIFF